MYTLEKLSGMEQKLYFTLEAEDERVVNAKRAMKILNVSQMHAYNLLKSMYEKGALDKVKSNLYVRVPAHIVHNRGNYIEDPIIVAKNIAVPYFFSYYTALSLHGLAQQYTKTFYISTIRPIRKITYHGNVIRPVTLIQKRFFGFREMKYENERVMASDLERTVVDVVNRPEYAGGYEEIFRCMLDVEKLNWQQLLTYIDKMEEKILVNRLGYLFELLRKQVHTPDFFLKSLQKRISENIYSFEQRSGTFDRKWRIIVDERLEKAVEAG